MDHNARSRFNFTHTHPSSFQGPHSEALLILINFVERVSEENEKLKIEIQKLRDENNRLKIEALGQENQGTPVPASAKKSMSTGAVFIDDALAICNFLGTTYGGVLPHP